MGHAESPGRFPRGPAAQGPKWPWARLHHARVVARAEGSLTARESVGSVPVGPARASGLSEPWCRIDPPGAQVPAGSSWKAQPMLGTRAHAVYRRCGTPPSPGRQASGSACAHDTRACRRDASRIRAEGHSGPGRRYDTTPSLAGPATAILGTMTQPTYYPQDFLGQQRSSRAGIVGPAANHQRLQQKKKYSNRPPCGVNTFPLKRSAEIFEIRLDSLWQVLRSIQDDFTPAHHPAGISVRDRHRLSQHHPYDLALYLSLPRSQSGPARPGPT